MAQVHQKLIDGYQVSLSPLPAFAALEQFTALTGLLGPAALSLLGKDEALAAALAASVRNVKGSDVVSIIRALLVTCQVTVNGSTVPILPIFDTEFQGKLLTVFKIAAFAVEVNYGDFFAAAKGALGALGEKMKAKVAASISPTT